MRIKRIAKRTISIFSVFLLILSLNLSVDVSAELISYPDDGIAIDEFENDNSISKENCTLAPGNGSIILEYGPISLVYDHKNTPKNIKGWYEDSAFITPGGDLGSLLALLINPDLLPKEEFDDLKKIDAQDDGQFLETTSLFSRGLGITYYPVHLFQIKIDENVDRLGNLNVEWWSGPYNESAGVDELRMYLWSHGEIISRWHFIGSLDYTEENITPENGYISESAVNPNKFLSEEGTLHILVVAEPVPEIAGEAGAILSTDYVKVDFSLEKGFNPNGYITSDLITPNPNKFYGWENIIWERSVPTGDTYVKLQVLNSDGEVIESLEGNSDGFLNSPIDLSSLGTSHSNIKLKAIFHTDNYDVTPRLYKWIVLWQIKDGFNDSFTFDYRVAESFGAEAKDGKVTISEFYSEWPIFGKNPTNTRSYVGPDIEKNTTYWQTYINRDIGGWFRSPIVGDGIVYIGARDKRIYGLNLSLSPDDNANALSPVYKTGEFYEIESAIAYHDDSVIFGTSSININYNRIYAYNKELDELRWVYSHGNDKTICYSAAPTISGDNIYFTSWSGKSWNSPLFSYFISSISKITENLLNLKIEENNKLIGLDIASGQEIWDPIYLPGGSLSTPAVKDGLIFVGCDNIGDSTVFAFNEESGDEVWNASVGTVGRASPVIVESDNGDILIVIVREQTLFSFEGTDKVVGLDASDGSELWNFTIGNTSALLRTSNLRLKNFTNLKATYPPSSSPAVYGNTVFIASPSGILYALDVNTGEEKWRFEESATSSYHTSSPVIVNDNVIIISQGSLLGSPQLYALETSNGKLIRDYPITYEDAADFSGYLYSSPIVTDGLVVVSILEWLPVPNEFFGHLKCYGEYKKNSIGQIYSIPIHVQKGKWWNKFNAGYISTRNNTIKFSIVNEDGDILKSGLNGRNNKISDVKENVIQLCAELSYIDEDESEPQLKSWEIEWTVEDRAPKFINSSFRAGEGLEGWTNLDLKECSISVKDIGFEGITSGIDTNSAEFLVGYEGSGAPVWHEAVCDDEFGALQTTIRANISALNIDISDLHNISFRIKDLAQNQETSEPITFKLDTKKPTSEISNITDFEENYKDAVEIKAIGDDDNSGVAKIGLYYRPIETNTTDWIEYKIGPPYHWLFENDTSNYYEFCTIATDKAGNKEAFPDLGDVSFLFDMNIPSKPTFDDEGYYFNQLPEFDIDFEDDFLLNAVEYRLNFHGLNEWTVIADNISSKNYTQKWSISQDVWNIMTEDSSYHLYFLITDYCGNQYKTTSIDESLNLTKDVTPPIAEITIALSQFDEGWDDTFTITAEIPDNVDDVDTIRLEYSYSANNKDWSNWKQYGDELSEGPFEWDFKATKGSGYYRFKTIISDAAGNTVESPIEKINVSLFPTTLLLLMFVIILILFIVTIRVIKKMTKIKS